MDKTNSIWRKLIYYQLKLIQIKKPKEKNIKHYLLSPLSQAQLLSRFYLSSSQIDGVRWAVVSTQQFLSPAPFSWHFLLAPADASPSPSSLAFCHIAFGFFAPSREWGFYVTQRITSKDTGKSSSISKWKHDKVHWQGSLCNLPHV